MAAAPFYEKSSENFSNSKFLVEDDAYEERYDSDFTERPGSSWTARLRYIGLEEETLCKMQGVSMSTLEEIWSANSIDSLTEKVLSAFRIPVVTPTGLSQQFELGRELSRITLYVQGGYHSTRLRLRCLHEGTGNSSLPRSPT